METEFPLAELCPGQHAEICSVSVHDSLLVRLGDLGLVPGTLVTCLYTAPAGSPMAFRFRGTVIALRRKDAEQIGCRREYGDGN